MYIDIRCANYGLSCSIALWVVFCVLAYYVGSEESPDDGWFIRIGWTEAGPYTFIPGWLAAAGLLVAGISVFFLYITILHEGEIRRLRRGRKDKNRRAESQQDGS